MIHFYNEWPKYNKKYFVLLSNIFIRGFFFVWILTASKHVARYFLLIFIKHFFRCSCFSFQINWFVSLIWSKTWSDPNHHQVCSQWDNFISMRVWGSGRGREGLRARLAKQVYDYDDCWWGRQRPWVMWRPWPWLSVKDKNGP